MDPGKTQNLEASLKVQSGLKTGRQLENLVQEVAGHINFSSNLKVYHWEHQKQLKTLYGNHGTKEIWALDYTHTHTIKSLFYSLLPNESKLIQKGL